MKKIFLSFLILILNCIAFADVQISPSLVALLELTGVDNDGTYDSILEQTQKKWLRPTGKERWQIADVDAEKRFFIIELAQKLGFIEEIRPQGRDYEYGVVLGGTVGKMEERFNYLIQLWKEGVRFKQIVFLTGMRPLDPAVEMIQENCKNESEASRMIWKNASIPNQIRQLAVTFIEVPMFITEKGAKRPSTKDTFIAWAASAKPGRTLVISNQPFCLYQHALALSCLPSSFQVETVGPAANKEKELGVVVLDSIAQWIYYSSL